MLALRRFTSSHLSLRAVRAYSAKDNSGPTPTGNPDSFGKREKASEDWYIKQHEKDHVKKLQDEIAKRESELGDLKKRAEQLKH